MGEMESSNSAPAKNIQLQSSNEQPEEVELQSCDAEKEGQERESDTEVAYFHQRLQEMIAGDSCNFDAWIALIEEVERMCPDNLAIMSLTYDSFLSRFPLCHWYWRKYADHIVRLSDAHAAIKVFERAVGAATLSVGLWVVYCQFGMRFYEDPFDVRRLFKRALMHVQRDYLCHALWNEYIKFEFTQQSWGFLANIYLQVLRFPTEYLQKYYDNAEQNCRKLTSILHGLQHAAVLSSEVSENHLRFHFLSHLQNLAKNLVSSSLLFIFKQFVGGMEEELRKQNDCRIEVKPLHNAEFKWSEYEISQVIMDLQNPPNEVIFRKAVHTYQSIGEEFYQKSNEFDEKIRIFETNIQRRYFDTSPLDEGQLQNWHQYLDFIENQEDFDWALQVYERCLIPCAYYPEFWMRYVEFMESKGGREFANSALERATQVFLKNVPEIHLFSARFKEQIGDSVAVSVAFLQCLMGSGYCLPKYIIELANIQRRKGKLEEACATLDKAINLAEKMQKLHNYSSLFIHSSRLKYLITGSAETARDVLIEGIQRIPLCCELLEELIKFAMTHEGSKQVNLIDSIIAQAISPPSEHGSQCLVLKDRERISCLFLEFVDLCGTLDDVRKAWVRHVELFPHLIRNNVVDERLGAGDSGYCGSSNLRSKGRHSYVVPVNHAASKVEVVCRSQISQTCFDNMPVDETTLAAAAAASEQVDTIPGKAESNKCLPGECEGNIPGPVETTHALPHVSGEGTSGLQDKTCDHSTAFAVSESSEKHSISFDNQDQEPQQHPPRISFNDLSLHSQGKPSSDTISATDSVQVKKSPGATTTHPDSLLTPSVSGEHQMHSGAVTKNLGLHLPSKLHHQHQQPSVSEEDPSLKGLGMPTLQAYPQHPGIQEQVGHSQVQNKEGAAQENIAANQLWPANNVQDVSSSSASQSSMSAPLISYIQPNSQQGLQGSQQLIPANSSQTSSQVWQYSQHLLQQQYQQQVVQMLPYQQSYHQLQQFQLQQQHNHQFSSWQQLQQQRQLQLQYHQLTQQLQLQQGQQQQLLSVNEQQLQLYHQSEKLDHEMNQQGYQQNAAQAYQTSFQQYQLHQQAYGQMLQQHQQQQYQYNLMQQLHRTSPQEPHQLRTSNHELLQSTGQQSQGRQSAVEGLDSMQTEPLSTQSQQAVSLPKQQSAGGTSASHDMDIPGSAALSPKGQ